MYNVFPTFLQIFFTISLKFQKTFLIFLYNFHKISNIKLLRCFLIIFPKLIQHLLRNFFKKFLKFLQDFIKMFKILYRSQSKILSKFFQISNISSKFPASNSKFVFPNSPNTPTHFPKNFQNIR